MNGLSFTGWFKFKTAEIVLAVNVYLKTDVSELLPQSLGFLLYGLWSCQNKSHVSMCSKTSHCPVYKGYIKLMIKTDSYLKKGHVGAIIAVAFVIVCVVDKGTVFLWDAITCGNTKQLFLYNECSVGLICHVTKAKYGWWLAKKYTVSTVNHICKNLLL